MRLRYLTALGLAVLGSTVAFAQSGPTPPAGPRVAAGKPYVPSKTPWGDPDLQGLWPGTFDIPLERNPSFGLRNTLTDAELAERESRNQSRQATDRGGSEFLTGKEVVDIDHPPYWVEYRDPHRQASLIIDPPDGRLPKLTPAGEARRVPRITKADSWEDFGGWQRCISRGVYGSMMVTLYNNGNQILQAPGYVIIRNEMVHEARVIPLDGRPHVNGTVRSYMGDSRGHWEGNSLVVETTNLKDMNGIGGYRPSPSAKLVERFTRTAPDQLAYDLTVVDPETWTAPWTIRYPYKLDPEYPLFEYACHEANYGLENILTGARAGENSDKSGGDAATPGKVEQPQ